MAAPKTTADKLLIKPGSSAWISAADHRSLLEPLPEGASWADGPAGATTAVLFADDRASLAALLDAHGTVLARPSHVWFAYPKGGRSDLNRDSLWPIVSDSTGMRPITQIALDDTWSAVRFRPLQTGEAPFTGGRPRNQARG